MQVWVSCQQATCSMVLKNWSSLFSFTPATDSYPFVSCSMSADPKFPFRASTPLYLSNNPSLSSHLCLLRTPWSIFQKDSKIAACSRCPHALLTTSNPRAHTCWFFLLFPGWQIAGQCSRTSLHIHHIMRTMGLASAWNIHIHPPANGQSHPQGAAPTFSSPHMPLPLSVPLNVTDSDHRSLSSSSKYLLSPFPVLISYCLWKKDPFLFLGFMPEHLMPLPSPWKVPPCFISTLAASLWRTPKCFPPPRKSFLHSDFS